MPWAEEMPPRRYRPTSWARRVADPRSAYKVTQGLLDEFGARRVIDTTDHETRLRGLGTSFPAFGGSCRPIRSSYMTSQLRHAWRWVPYRQLRRPRRSTCPVGQIWAPPMVFRGLAQRLPPPPGWVAQRQPGLRRLVFPRFPGPQGGCSPIGPSDAQGPAQDRDPRSQPELILPRERDPLRPAPSSAGPRGFHHPLRQGQDLARGHGCDHRSASASA